MNLKAEIMAIFRARNMRTESLWEDLVDEIVRKVHDKWLDDIAWYTNEVNWHCERADDLELDLMFAQSLFGVHDRTQATYNPKRRSNFEK